ncbi:hypothetical protein D3C84_1238920 [compost metagenome]
MLAITPKLQDGMVNLHNGITVGPELIQENQNEAIQNIFTFFEDEILRSPSIWAPYILQSVNKMSSYIPGK